MTKGKLLFLVLWLGFSTVAYSQNVEGAVKDAKTRKPLDYASVVAMERGGNPVAFCTTAPDGSFTLKISDGQKADTLQFSMLGYTTQKVAALDYRSGMTVYLRPEAVNLKEVEVKSKRLQMKSDTLMYSVAGYRQKQDRSIADVIAKMPGLEVTASGTIKYQGKPINKFYIEGMDLMGKKYAMASENLQAKKVKSVEVLRHHQPIKALKGVSFSDDAAINLVLEDAAKNVITGMAELGAGAQLQRGIGSDVLRDVRIVGMLFGRKQQSLTMYKANNAGRDIQHEIRDLTLASDLSADHNNWIDGISVSASQLKLERYNCNDTHIAATNWLRKTGTDATVRLQATYLFDKTIGYVKDATTFTSILGLPVVEEETSADKYRREVNAELLYKINADSLYLENNLKTSVDWNESSAITALNGSPVIQHVQPRKRDFSDRFEMHKKLHGDRSFQVKAMVDYRYQPGRLLTINDTVPQRLNAESLDAHVSTGFRHRLFGMYISYDAQLNYQNDDIRLQQNETLQKTSYREIGLVVTPRLSFERSHVRLSVYAPVYLASYKLGESKENKNFVNPYFNFGYKPSGMLDFSFGYSHQLSNFGISNNVPLTYFTNYTTRIQGNGRLDFITLDNYSGRMEYSNPMVGVFFNLSGGYLRTYDVPMFSYSYEDNVYTMQTHGTKSNNEQIMVSAEISKTLGYGKTTFTLGGNLLRNNYGMLVADVINHSHLTSYSADFKFAFMPSALFSLEETSTFSSVKSTNSTNPGLSTGALNSFNHKLTMFFMPGDWEISWTNELYHGNDNSLKTAFFSDLGVKWAQKSFELSISMNNIVGTTRFERTTISSTYMLYSFNRLRPRELMAKIALSL